jgi:hypothetical protein
VGTPVDNVKERECDDCICIAGDQAASKGEVIIPGSSDRMPGMHVFTIAKDILIIRSFAGIQEIIRKGKIL